MNIGKVIKVIRLPIPKGTPKPLETDRPIAVPNWPKRVKIKVE